ncbi:MAG: hypothetical protein ABIR28_10500 [Vicinamibacteria bacterium]
MTCALLVGSMFTAASAQDEVSSVATLHLADGSTVALVEWKLSYEFIAWKQKEPVSSAKARRVNIPMLVLGKKTYPVQGDSLSLTHLETEDTARVVSMSLKKSGDFKVEQPARDILAPDLEKSMVYQPRSLDISGKSLSGMDRAFCIASFSPLLECGLTKTTRIVKIDFK